MKNMLKGYGFAVLASVLLAASGPALADVFDIPDGADSSSLKPFARDLGSLLGSDTFHSGRPLGFSGFDLGAHGAVQLRPESRDGILRKAGSQPFGIPWIQAEIGLPFRLDGFIRGVNYQGMTVAGGGLRYGLLKVSDQPWSPQILVSGSANNASGRDFSANHFGFNLVGSVNFPIVTPYVGAGFDRTRVTVLASHPSSTSALIGSTATATAARFTGGVTFRPYPFTYLHAAYTFTHGQPGFDMGLGIRF